MPEIPPWFTLAGAVTCTAFAVLITIDSGFGMSAALLVVLAVLFLIVTVVEPGSEVRKAFVRLLTWWRL